MAPQMLLLPTLISALLLLVASTSAAAPSSAAAAAAVKEPAPASLFFEGGSFVAPKQQQSLDENDGGYEGGEEDGGEDYYAALAAMEEQAQRQRQLQQQQRQQARLQQEMMLAAAMAQAREQAFAQQQEEQEAAEQAELEEAMARERLANVLAFAAANQHHMLLPADESATDFMVPVDASSSLDATPKAKTTKTVATAGGNNDKKAAAKASTEKQAKPLVKKETKSVAVKAVPAKKGQYEFVEFADPVVSAKLRGLDGAVEKRVPVVVYGIGDQSSEGGFFRGFTNTGNLLFIAAVAMCCAVATVGVAGGAYWYKSVRAARDDPFDEFMRYSPTGPGRDKLSRKAQHLPSNRLSPTGGAGGGGCPDDDTLAYKAQLHHYRQAKQRIVGGGRQQPVDDDEDFYEEEEDDELNTGNNFSVYECPGLAPVGGDTAVENPNFVGSATLAKSPSPVPSPQGSASPRR